jgi:hypothetical protein
MDALSLLDFFLLARGTGRSASLAVALAMDGGLISGRDNGVGDAIGFALVGSTA